MQYTCRLKSLQFHIHLREIRSDMQKSGTCTTYMYCTVHSESGSEVRGTPDPAQAAWGYS